MENFIINAILWTLALYGLFELVKQVINIITYTNLSADGIYLIIGVKNQEEKIEGFLRSSLFKILYGKEEYIKDVILLVLLDLLVLQDTKQNLRLCYHKK